MPAALLFALAAALAFAGPKPPLDFSGLWVLDETASRGVSKNMRGAVLRVEQSGDHIRLFPVGHDSRILGEEIVADGRPYEKALGAGRGVVTAAWSKDGASLWLEVRAGPPGQSGAAIQRSVWKLSGDRKTWIRHSVSAQAGERREAWLIFRKREKTSKPTPSPRPARGTH